MIIFNHDSIPFARSNIFKGFVRRPVFATVRRLSPGDFLQGRQPFPVVIFPARSRGIGNYFLEKSPGFVATIPFLVRQIIGIKEVSTADRQLQTKKLGVYPRNWEVCEANPQICCLNPDICRRYSEMPVPPP